MPVYRHLRHFHRHFLFSKVQQLHIPDQAQPNFGSWSAQLQWLYRPDSTRNSRRSGTGSERHQPKTHWYFEKEEVPFAPCQSERELGNKELWGPNLSP